MAGRRKATEVELAAPLEALFQFAGLFCRGYWQFVRLKPEDPDSLPWTRRIFGGRVSAKVISDHLLGKLYLYGNAEFPAGRTLLTTRLAFDLDVKGTFSQPLADRIDCIEMLFGVPDLHVVTPSGGRHLYYFMPNADAGLIEDRARRLLQGEGLEVRDGNVEIFPRNRVLRLPLGRNMQLLDPKTREPIEGTVPELLDIVEGAYRSRSLRRALHEPVPPRLAAPKVESRRPPEGIRHAEALRAVRELHEGRVDDTLGSNELKMAFVQYHWLTGTRDREEVVDLIADELTRPGLEHLSRPRERPEAFRQDIAATFDHWRRRMMRCETPQGFSRADIDWIRETCAPVRWRTGGHSQIPLPRRNFLRELWLAHLVGHARNQGSRDGPGFSVDLPRTIEERWGIVGKNRLAQLRRPLVRTRDQEAKSTAIRDLRRHGLPSDPEAMNRWTAHHRESMRISTSELDWPVFEIRRAYHPPGDEQQEGHPRRMWIRHQPVEPIEYTSYTGGLLATVSIEKLLTEYSERTLRKVVGWGDPPPLINTSPFPLQTGKQGPDQGQGILRRHGSSLVSRSLDPGLCTLSPADRADLCQFQQAEGGDATTRHTGAQLSMSQRVGRVLAPTNRQRHSGPARRAYIEERDHLRDAQRKYCLSCTASDLFTGLVELNRRQDYVDHTLNPTPWADWLNGFDSKLPSRDPRDLLQAERPLRDWDVGPLLSTEELAEATARHWRMIREWSLVITPSQEPRPVSARVVRDLAFSRLTKREARATLDLACYLRGNLYPLSFQVSLAMKVDVGPGFYAQVPAMLFAEGGIKGVSKNTYKPLLKKLSKPAESLGLAWGEEPVLREVLDAARSGGPAVKGRPKTYAIHAGLVGLDAEPMERIEDCSALLDELVELRRKGRGASSRTRA